jgi:hypothetical protein
MGSDGEEPRQVAIVTAILLAVDHHVIEARIKLLRHRMGVGFGRGSPEKSACARARSLCANLIMRL